MNDQISYEISSSLQRIPYGITGFLVQSGSTGTVSLSDGGDPLPLNMFSPGTFYEFSVGDASVTSGKLVTFVNPGSFNLSARDTLEPLAAINSTNGAWWVAKERGTLVFEQESPVGASVWSGSNVSYEENAVVGLTASVFSTTVAGITATDSSAIIHQNNANFSSIPDEDVSISFYIDPGSADHYLGTWSNCSGNFRIDFSTETTTRTGEIVSASLVPVENGFYRVSLISNSHNALSFSQLRMAPVANTGSTTSIAATNVKLAGVQKLMGTEPLPFGTGVTYGYLVDQAGGDRHLTLPGGTNNPVLLDHTGTDYFWFPNVSANYLSSTNPATGSITKLRVEYYDAFSNASSTLGYVPSSWQNIGRNTWRLWDAGPGGDEMVSLPGVQTTNGIPFWRAYEFDSGSVYGYNGGTDSQPSWSLAATTSSSWTALAQGVETLNPMWSTAGGPLYRMRVYIDDVLVFDVQASDDTEIGSDSFTCATGQTVTKNRSGTGYQLRTVNQPVYVGAVDDIMSTSGSTANDLSPTDNKFTAIWVGTVDQLFDAFVFSQRQGPSAGTPGWSLRVLGSGGNAGRPLFELADGTSEVNIVTLMDFTGSNSDLLNDIVYMAVSANGNTVTGYDSVGKTADFSLSSLGPITTTEPIKIFGGWLYSTTGFIGAAVIKDALNESEIITLKNSILAANGGTP